MTACFCVQLAVGPRAHAEAAADTYADGGRLGGVADWRGEADRWWAQALGLPADAMHAGGVSRPAISITLALLPWPGRPPRCCTGPLAPGRPCATCWSTRAVRVPSMLATSRHCWARGRAACSGQPGTATPPQAAFRRCRTGGCARSPERICRSEEHT